MAASLQIMRIMRRPIPFRWLVRAVSLLVVGALWEVFGRQTPAFTSYPSEILAAAYEIIVVENRVIPAFAATLHGLFVGFAIAAVLGTVIGIAMGRIDSVDAVLSPYVMALYATPRIAIVPLLVLWAGIGFELRVTIVVLSAIFPIIISTHAGIREVETEYLETAAAFCASKRKTLTTVVLPAAVPFIFAGLRIGIAKALIGVVVAEMTAAVTGTGSLIIQFGKTFQADRLFVPVILLGFLSIILARMVVVIQHRLTPWADEQRA